MFGEIYFYNLRFFYFFFFTLSPAINENIYIFNLRMFQYENVWPSANDNVQKNKISQFDNCFTFFKLQPLPLIRMLGEIIFTI